MCQKIIVYLLLIVISCIAFSCSMCECSCVKRLGCKIITVKILSNDSLIERKILCSQRQVDFYADTALKNSADSFALSYKSDTTSILITDSIYKNELIRDLKCGQTSKYTKIGFDCICAD